MSDTALTLIITVAIIVFLFAWIPTLHICNAACQRFFLRSPEPSRDPAPDLREEEDPTYIGASDLF